MNEPTTEMLATMSVKGLQTIDMLLRGTKMGRKESKVQAADRVSKALAAERDTTAIENLPSLLRSRNFGEDADKLDAMLVDADAHDDVSDLPSDPYTGFNMSDDELEKFDAQEVAGGEVDDRDFGVGPSDETFEEEPEEMVTKAASRARSKINGAKSAARSTAAKARAKAADAKAAKELKAATEAKTKADAKDAAEAKSAAQAKVAAEVQAAFKAELETAAAAHREALAAVKAAEAAAKVTKAAFLAAQKAAKVPGSKRNVGTPPKAAPKPGTRAARIVGLLERPEGLSQSQITAEFGPKYSAFYQANLMAATYGRTASVEGEGRARIFRLTQAA